MFRRRRLSKIRRDYDLQRAPEFLVDYEPCCADRTPGQPDIDERRPVGFVPGNQPAHLLTRVDELRLSHADVPLLTITADPGNGVAVTGTTTSEWSLRFCAQGEGDTEEEARERLRERSMVRAGSAVSLTGPHLLRAEPTRMGRGQLLVDAPADAALVIHASFAAVQIRDLNGPVRVAATHARATILNSTGRVDAIAMVVDFAGSKGRVTLSSEAEINLKFSAVRFEGTLSAWAQRAVKTLVPAGFVTPFRAIVSRRHDFVCRTDFCSRVRQERHGDLYYFTYDGDGSVAPEAVMHLRSEHATVVIDTIEEDPSGASWDRIAGQRR